MPYGAIPYGAMPYGECHLCRPVLILLVEGFMCVCRKSLSKAGALFRGSTLPLQTLLVFVHA